MFLRAIEVTGKDDFRQARRRLWSWESELPDSLCPANVHRCLESLVAGYNKAVEQQVRQTRLQTVFLLVPAVAGIAIDQLFGGGMASTLLALAPPPLSTQLRHGSQLTGDAAGASHHPGSAFEGMLSVVGHG
jgi:hypothetical protein